MVPFLSGLELPVEVWGVGGPSKRGPAQFLYVPSFKRFCIPSCLSENFGVKIFGSR